MRRIYKQPNGDIQFCFFLFFVCIFFISYGYFDGNIDIVKWIAITLAVAECAYISAELDSRDKDE